MASLKGIYAHLKAPVLSPAAALLPVALEWLAFLLARLLGSRGPGTLLPGSSIPMSLQLGTATQHSPIVLYVPVK